MKRLAPLTVALLTTACVVELPNQQPPGTCPPDSAQFGEVVDVPLLQSRCIACHVVGGAAESTRLLLVGGTTPDVHQANMETIFALAGETDGDLPLIVAKPTNQAAGGHGGGEVIAPDSPDAQRLSFVANWGRGELTTCEAPEGLAPTNCADTPARGGRQLRRLTRDEYFSTVFDLTGVDPGFVDIPLEQSAKTFDSDAATLVVNDQFAEKLARAAEGVAERVVEGDIFRISPCGADQSAACREQFLREFGARTFRRPLTADELARYGEYFDLVEAEEGRTVAIREVTTAMLSSPNFLYRAELGIRDGDNFALTGYEIATELSYLVVGSTPDDALLRAAANRRPRHRGRSPGGHRATGR